MILDDKTEVICPRTGKKVNVQDYCLSECHWIHLNVEKNKLKAKACCCGDC